MSTAWLTRLDFAVGTPTIRGKRANSSGFIMHWMSQDCSLMRQISLIWETTEELLRSIIPKDAKNIFVSSDTIKNGYKYNFNINGKKIGIKWHSEDLNAAVKYPGSNSGSGWTAQIKVGKKLLGQDGKFYKKAKNSTHIPLRR